MQSAAVQSSQRQIPEVLQRGQDPCLAGHGGSVCPGIQDVLSLSAAWRWQREQEACQLHGYAPKNTDKIKHRQCCGLSYQVMLLRQQLCKEGQQGLFPPLPVHPQSRQQKHPQNSLQRPGKMCAGVWKLHVGAKHRLKHHCLEETPDTRSPVNTSRSSCMYSMLWILLDWPTSDS